MTRATLLDRHAVRILYISRALEREESATDDVGILANIDYLVRYPSVLAATYRTLQRPLPAPASLTDIEGLALEQSTVRFKYSASAGRYVPVLGVLVGLRLAEVFKRQLLPTGAGLDVLDALEVVPVWEAIEARSSAAAVVFRSVGKELAPFVRQHLPDGYVEVREAS